MSTVEQSQGAIGRMWQVMMRAVPGLVARRGGRHARAHAGQLDAMPLASTVEASVRASELFVQALCDDSNCETDWLWLATQVVRDHERRYCLERALYINPDSLIARQELARLAPLPAHILRLQGYSY